MIWALKDVSLEVEPGNVVGMIGRNGAGKTTLLKILSRITEPTEGVAEIRGRIGSLLEVGTGFHWELTGRENIYLNGAILGMRRAEIASKFDDIVSFAGVERFIDTPLKHYSSGMYIRLAFAVAAHLETEVMLVDEVLAVGDITFQKRCLGKMDELAKGGRTVVFVSHNMSQIRKLCQTAYWLDGGGLKRWGPVDEIVDLYERDALEEAGARTSSNGKTRHINEEFGIEVHSIEAVVNTREGVQGLRVEIRGYARRVIDLLEFVISITTPEGVLITKLGPRMANSILEHLNGNWICTFEFDEVTRYLAGGEYLIHLMVHSPNRGPVLTIDNAAVARIPETDSYNAGLYFQMKRHGLVPLPVRFSCEREASTP